MRHAQFHHRGLVCSFEPQQSERQSVFVVQIAFGLQYAEPRGQQRRQNFFRGGLSHRAGDGAMRRPFPPRRSRRPGAARFCSAASVSATAKSRARIVRRIFGKRSRATTAASAPLQSAGDKIVSIVTRSVYGDEQLAASHGARINRDTGQPGQGVEARGKRDTQRAAT